MQTCQAFKYYNFKKNMQQSILNLFEINLESIPDKFFIEDPAEVDMSGKL